MSNYFLRVAWHKCLILILLLLSSLLAEGIIKLKRWRKWTLFNALCVKYIIDICEEFNEENDQTIFLLMQYSIFNILVQPWMEKK